MSIKRIFTACFISMSVTSFAQSVGVNTDALPADGSAMLDVRSTDKGMLIPRMTDAQKMAIVTPATGLMVYQTDATAGFYYYDGAAWTYINSVGPVGPMGATGATGAQGIQGDPGPQGIQGDPGATGPMGPMGPMGTPGATGPAGPAGPTGPAGAAGATGGTGIVATYTINVVSNTPTTTTGWGTQLTGVVVGAGQKVIMIASCTYGSVATGGATSLRIYPAYALGTGAPITQTGGTWDLQVPQNSRLSFPVSHVFTGLAAGTYSFGISCQASTNPGNWNNNEYGYVTCIVTN